MLLVHERGERQVLGATAHREDVLVVAQDGDLALVLESGDHHGVQYQFTVGEHGTDALAKNGHEDRIAAGPVYVEPVGMIGLLAVGQDRPEGLVEVGGGGHGHVVRHHIGHQSDAPFACLPREVAKAGLAAEDRGDP
ncbi:hypothetical protein GCM10025876_00980 [Demequina litorisediminis]|uniref:Uncharacterized protein n=1 Tax=Demequina litorisediminis TaxID=1849022 RepID=A0ABQ6I7U6_9MICO|nr:hypothetical protein GCM10025876_00980 [Demequina litorisediminis]